MRYKTDQRYELKYLLHHDQVSELRNDLASYMNFDPHGDRGRYQLSSLYFDTAGYKAYWDKVEGHRYRRKVRVRLYGDGPVNDETPVFIEVKQRLDRALEKRRVRLPYAQAVDLARLDRPIDGISATDRATLDEVNYLARALQLRPACIVAYDRIALEASEYDPGLRITFDTNLRGRVHDLTLRSQGNGGHEYFLPPDWTIMEIKINHRTPYWLTEIIGKHGCTLRRISKYCSALENCKAIAERQHIITS
jgi:hypothetical protein